MVSKEETPLTDKEREKAYRKTIGKKGKKGKKCESESDCARCTKEMRKYWRKKRHNSLVAAKLLEASVQAMTPPPTSGLGDEGLCNLLVVELREWADVLNTIGRQPGPYPKRLNRRQLLRQLDGHYANEIRILTNELKKRYSLKETQNG